MKVFFGINTTNGINSHRFDSDSFIVQKVSDEHQRLLDEKDELLDTIKAKIELPAVLKTVAWIAIGAAAVIVKVMKDLLRDTTWAEFWKNSSWVVYVGIACVAVYGIIMLMAHIRGKKVSEDVNTLRDIDSIAAAREAASEMLGVPSNADSMDILAGQYIIINGEIVFRKNGPVTFFNGATRIFRQDDTLYITDRNTKWAIPRACMTGIRRIKKRVALAKWNKETAHNKGEYKEYKIRLNGYDNPIIKYYYALCITCEGEDYELYFPPYELPIIEKLTGLRAEI